MLQVLELMFNVIRDNFIIFQTLLEAGFISVYNLFYTSQPVLALACFDQDVKPIYATKVHTIFVLLHTHRHDNFILF